MSAGSAQETSKAAAPKLPEVDVLFPAALLGCRMTDMVVYYVTGDRGGAGCPAVVALNQSNGLLNLIALRGQMSERKDAVRHIDDPFFKEHANVLRRDGAWDYGPGMAPPKESAPVTVEAAVLDVIRHWNNNHSPEVIAQKVRPMLTVNGELVIDPKTFVQVTLKDYVPRSRVKN